jgi:hypothetical protein
MLFFSPLFCHPSFYILCTYSEVLFVLWRPLVLNSVFSVQYFAVLLSNTLSFLSYFLLFCISKIGTPTKCPSTKRPATKRPATKRPAYKTSSPTKRPTYKTSSSTKRPRLQNILVYKTSRLQKVLAYKTSSSTKRPSTKRPSLSLGLAAKYSESCNIGLVG